MRLEERKLDYFSRSFEKTSWVECLPVLQFLCTHAADRGNCLFLSFLSSQSGDFRLHLSLRKHIRRTKIQLLAYFPVCYNCMSNSVILYPLQCFAQPR